MKRFALILVAAVLVLSLGLQGCLPILEFYEDFLPEFSTYPTEHSRPNYSEEGIHHSEYQRLYEPRLEYTVFDQMPYSRPDIDAVCADFDVVTELGKEEADFDSIIAAYEKAYDGYVNFSTMSSLAYIRYTLNLNDSYYEEEQLWCEENSPVLEKVYEEAMMSLADCSLRETLEAEYFGEDFFDDYDDEGMFTKDIVVELFQKESDLQAQYMALTSDMTIELDGEEVLLDEALSSATDYYTYSKVLRLYCEKYNPLMGEIFIELVRTRHALARELEYDSYADFAYDYYFYRDYTPQQADQYAEDIRNYLVPLMDLQSGGYYPSMSGDEVMDLLKDTTDVLGGEFQTAYGFMKDYELYDISYSTSKMPGSYQTYLSAYEMPFLYVSPEGDMGDFLTAAHEFGHFVDGYVNCDTNYSTDCAEIFSQGLEFLALEAAPISESDRRTLRENKLSDSLMTFISQACYHSFESAVYALPEEELTLENINNLFYESNLAYGLATEGYEFYDSMAWFDIQHFIIAPCYVISYCVSNDMALQIYQLEAAEGGKGLEKYFELLYLAADNTILSLASEGEMTSPFALGRMDELAKFFEERMG